MPPFRHAMCNEPFENTPFAAQCKAMRAAGYQGIEIAPFTLGETPAHITPAQRRDYRDIIASEGLDFVGFHWIMVNTGGLHLTAPDAALRARSWQYIRELIDLSDDLGPHGVLVFGSPKQRSSTGGITPCEATKNFTEGMASVADHAWQRGVALLVEALPTDQSDVINTMAQAMEVVRAINCPAVRTMFDVHNTLDETDPHDVLIDRYFDFIHHVHVNELDGRHCGTGSYDYKPVLAALRRRNYEGWISLEAFDYTPGAERLANESIRFLESEIAKIS